MANLERICTLTLEGSPLTMLILGGQLPWSTWKGSAMTLEGSPLTMLRLGSQSMVNLERICNEFGRITSDNVDLGRGQLTANLERIHDDFGRITSDNVDPWGSINGQLGKDL